jgi:hypothetical protein
MNPPEKPKRNRAQVALSMAVAVSVFPLVTVHLGTVRKLMGSQRVVTMLVP